MIDLDLAKRLAAGRTKGGYGPEPGMGCDEDDGTYIIGAVGGDYRFLLNDEWDYVPEPIPEGVLPEAEARRLAQADQDFARYMDTHADEILAEISESRERLRAYECLQKSTHEEFKRIKEELKALRKVAEAVDNLPVSIFVEPDAECVWDLHHAIHDLHSWRSLPAGKEPASEKPG